MDAGYARAVAVGVIRSAVRAVTLGLVLALGATAGIAAGAHAAAPTDDPPTQGCAWPLAYLYGPAAAGLGLDTDASYWVATLSNKPGATWTFSGSFPTARYMSFAMYDGPSSLYIPGGHIYDAQLVPASGVNPFQVNETGAGTYTLTVVAGTAPASPAPNTIYTGTTAAEPVTIAYRIYDSGVPGDPTGGAGLPSETASVNGVPTASYGGCASTAGVSAAVAHTASVTAHRLRRADGLTSSRAPAHRLHADAVPGKPAVPLWAATPNTSATNASFRNPDTAYIGAALYPNTNEVVVVKLKTPTFPDTDLGQPPWEAGQQVRYWSICDQDGYGTDECVDDAGAVTSGGYATFVISSPANRPTNATAANGVNWMALGTGGTNTLVYRQLLASPSYAQSIAGVKLFALPLLRMRAYFPRSRYCTVTEYEQVGPTVCLSAGL